MAKPPKPAITSIRRTVNLSELAVVLGRDPKTIHAWLKEDGFPVDGPGGKGVARIVEIGRVVRWLEDRSYAAAKREARKDAGLPDVEGPSREEAETRKAMAQAEMAEERLREFRGLLIKRDRAEQALTVTFGKIRETLEAVATRIAAELPGDRRAKARAVEIYQREVHDAMSRVSLSLSEVMDGATFEEIEGADVDVEDEDDLE